MRRLVVFVCFLLLVLPCYAQEENDLNIKPELLPENLRQLYFPEYKQTTKQEENKPQEKKQEPQKPTQAKPATVPQKKEETKKEETWYEKAIKFIFGEEPKPIASTPSTQPQEEPIQRQIQQEAVEIEGMKPLNEIIENAKANSPEVAKAKLEAEIIRRQNTFTPVPTFSVGNDFATGKMLISAGIQIPLEPLFTGKQRENYGRLVIRQKELEVEQKVIDQWTKIVNLNERLKKKQKEKKYAKQIVDNAEVQYKGGVINLSELLKAKELLWNTETAEQALEQELKAEKEKLRSIEYGAR